MVVRIGALAEVCFIRIVSDLHIHVLYLGSRTYREELTLKTGCGGCAWDSTFLFLPCQTCSGFLMWVERAPSAAHPPHGPIHPASLHSVFRPSPRGNRLCA